MIGRLAMAACAAMIGGAVLADPRDDMTAATGCRVPDTVTVEDAGPGRAVVTYYNSAEQCSGGLNQVVTTPGGITVRVIIDVNVDDFAAKERITVLPQTEGYFAFPPSEDLRDGETVEIIVMGGMA